MGSRLSYEKANRFAVNWLANVGEPNISAKKIAKMSDITTKDMRTIYRYRRMTEDLLGIELPSLNPKNKTLPQASERAGRFKQKKPFDAVFFSDAHWWPNQDKTVSHQLLLQVIEEIKPKVIVDNGDSLDGAGISRHPPMMWESVPTLVDEIENMQHHCRVIEKLAPKGCKLFRNLGNHDLRYEAKLAAMLPEFRGVKGTTFSELFPKWKHHYSLYINDNFKSKHNWKGGDYAAANNAKGSGISHLSSHLHRLIIHPHTNELGTIYGIETGMLADINAPQFHYAQDNTRNWRQGFVVVHFDGSRHYPELVEVVDNKAWFRGKWWKA